MNAPMVITIALIFINDVILSALKNKLIFRLMETKHNKQISKMIIKDNFRYDKKRGLRFSPRKYVFTRKHKELNNKSISKLSDLIMALYLSSWLLWVSFITIIVLEVILIKNPN